jgi:hypothetical protein
MLADRREDFGSHPLLELLGLGFAGAEDQGVQAGFVDDGNMTDLTTVLQGAGRVFIIIQRHLGIVSTDSECVTHVLGDEPDFTTFTFEDTNDSKEFMGELCRA